MNVREHLSMKVYTYTPPPPPSHTLPDFHDATRAQNIRNNGASDIVHTIPDQSSKSFVISHQIHSPSP